VAIDCKTLRRALNAGGKMPHTVNAWASEKGLVLGQVKVEKKTNEITAICELLRTLDLEGCAHASALLDWSGNQAPHKCIRTS
jgi:hypothetical protein